MQFVKIITTADNAIDASAQFPDDDNNRLSVPMGRNASTESF